MPVEFRSIDAKVQQADRHGFAIREAATQFHASEPFNAYIYSDLSSRKRYVAVNVNHEPPLELATIAGDLINNLASALDYLACALVTANGHTPNDDTYFPTAWSARQYATKVDAMKDSVGDAAHALLLGVEAYRGGVGESLWAMHELNRRDKHRLLLAVMSSYARFSLRPVGRPFEAMPPVQITVAPVYPVEDGMVLLGLEPDVDPEQTEFQFGLEIVFNEPVVAEGVGLRTALGGYFDAVRDTVDTFRSL